MLFEISQIKVGDKGFEPHPETDKLAEDSMANLTKEMDVVIGYFGVEMEARKQIIRTQETNFPSFLADMIRT